jgi:uncharacterized protein (DUF849 family)
LLTLLRDRGIKPEWEAFSPAHLTGEIAQLLPGSGSPPYLVNIVLGLDGAFQNAMPYSPRTLQFMLDMLPAGAVATVSVSGPEQTRGLTHALLLGAHVRVGIEDNPEIEPGVPGENARLVERIVSILHTLGLSAASPAEARHLLGLNAGKAGDG